jgi:hypothetical protein
MSDNRPKSRVAIEPRELEQMLRGQVQAVATHLLPNGREECGYWRVGSIEGEPGQSLALNLGGPMRGVWTDFSAPDKSPERSGDLLWLAARVRFGGNLADAISWGISYLGLDGLDPNRLATRRAEANKAANDAQQEAAKVAEQRRRSAQNLYLSARPIPGTAAEAYLVSRGIDLRAVGLDSPGSIKFHPEVYCKEVEKKMPCMVAGVVNLEGHHVATHRTWIRPDGSGKAGLVEPKKALGKFAGGFIPLWKGESAQSMRHHKAGEPILVSEGIEDGLTAAMARPQYRVIAAISLSNIGALVLPPDMGPLIILAQRDEKQGAIDALERAVARHQSAGRDVRLAYPPKGVKDYNELVDPKSDAGAQDNLWGGVNE